MRHEFCCQHNQEEKIVLVEPVESSISVRHINCVPCPFAKHLTCLEIVHNELVESSHIREEFSLVRKFVVQHLTDSLVRKLVVQELKVNCFNLEMNAVDFKAGTTSQKRNHFIINVIHCVSDSGNVFYVVEISIITNLVDQSQECCVNGRTSKELGNHE
ncbi:hypothetical protein HIRU_S54 [Hirudovirus strain Sangsue]|nr:hypothetical protein HIRU_S54 [Hirudovirus strain Sangsue]